MTVIFGLGRPIILLWTVWGDHFLRENHPRRGGPIEDNQLCLGAASTHGYCGCRENSGMPPRPVIVLVPVLSPQQPEESLVTALFLKKSFSFQCSILHFFKRGILLL